MEEHIRIGDLAARAGVTTHALRVWETRYGLLRPRRTPTGYRMYDEADLARVQAFVRLRKKGVPAAEAAQRVLSRHGLSAGTRSDASAIIDRMVTAAAAYDDTALGQHLEFALRERGLENALSDVVLPFLQRIGDLWQEGKLSIAAEHNASQALRQRLSALTHMWSTGTGPVALLACPSGERHDLALLGFGLLLRQRGWRIRYLGPDTPLSEVRHAAGVGQCRSVVLSATVPVSPADRVFFPAGVDVWVGGPGADALLAIVEGQPLPLPLVEAVEVVANSVRPSPA